MQKGYWNYLIKISAARVWFQETYLLLCILYYIMLIHFVIFRYCRWLHLTGLIFILTIFRKIWKTAYMSTYLSTWSNRLQSEGYSGKLLMTYSSPFLDLKSLDSLIFLLDFTGPCLMWHFANLWRLRSELSDRGQWKEDWSLPYSRNCLAASAHLWMTVAWGRSGTHPEVDGIAPSPGLTANCWEKAWSSGWMAGLSLVWVEVWCPQVEVLYHCNLGLCSKLQLRHANAMLRWSQQMWLQAAMFWENSKVQEGNWHRYKERVSRPQTGKNGSGMPAITVGIDFKGNTSSDEARPTLTGTEGKVFSGMLEVTSSINMSASASSREMVDWEVSGSCWLKHHSKISSRNEVLVPAQATFTLPKRSHLNLATLPSKWVASSNKVSPWKQTREDIIFKRNQVMGWMRIHIEE